MSDRSRHDDALDDDELFSSEDDDWQRLADDPELAGRLLRALEGIVPDILKRTLVSGVGSVLSEEGIRSILADKKLPKETLNFLVGQADTMRREVLRIISREIRIFLENMDFGGEIAKILTTLSFEIKTEIRFVPNDASLRPELRNRVSVKRADRDRDRDRQPEQPAPTREEAATPPPPPAPVPATATPDDEPLAAEVSAERDARPRGDEDTSVRKNLKRGIRWVRRKKDEVMEYRDAAAREWEREREEREEREGRDRYQALALGPDAAPDEPDEPDDL